VQNAKTREQRYFERFERASLSLTGMRPESDQAYSHFVSKETAFLRDVPSQILRNGAYRFASACTRHRSGLAGRPQIRKKSGRQTVLVTRELFEFSGPYCNLHTRKIERDLYLGTATRPLGRLPFVAHQDYEIPASLCITREPCGRWYVSFCYEQATECVIRTPEELSYEFQNRADLDQITVGLDLGCVLPVATSADQSFEIPQICQVRIARKDRQRARYQRRMARQTKGSKGRAKVAQRAAKCVAYGRFVRSDFAHKVSRRLVDSQAQIFVFEDLKLRNMTAAPAPKQDTAGRWAPNGSAAKAGLNKALLGSALGQIRQYTAYKAARANKLVLKVAPQNSSNECSACAHIDARSRRSQSEFCCTQCNLALNADFNAARVIKKRGIAQLRAGVILKAKKRARVRGKTINQVGRGSPEPGASPKLVETVQDGSGAMCPSRSSLGSQKPPLQPIAA
jgi:putative transposase